MTPSGMAATIAVMKTCLSILVKHSAELDALPAETVETERERMRRSIDSLDDAITNAEARP